MTTALLLIVIAVATYGLHLATQRLSERSSTEVVRAMRQLNEGDEADEEVASPQLRHTAQAQQESVHYGFGSAEELARFERKMKVIPLVGGLMVLAVRMVLDPAGIEGHVMYSVGTIAVCYILTRRMRFQRKCHYTRELEFHLPMVMERLVMAAQAGLDILPALRALADESPAAGEARANDPVTRLLLLAYSLTEAGLSFEDALHEVAGRTNCSAVRHAFIHLALAHKEGGELIAPLRELSDATQLYFQESVEEEIAKLPVKATAPLLCTFAGLMLFFLASPLVQILDFLAKAQPSVGG